MADPGLIIRTARALLAWTVPAWAREALIGDLDEDLARIAREQGHAAASRWYLREALVLGARYVTERRHGAPGAARTLTPRKEPMTVLMFLGNVARDLRLAGRQAVSQPGFWLSATLTLGIAIGFNATIFSLVNAVLFKPLARDNSDRVVRIYAQTDAHPASAGFSYLDYRTLKHGATAVTDVSAVHLATLVLSDGRASDQLLGEIVSGSYFQLLGAPVTVGRPLSTTDDTAAAPPAALLSEHYWRRRLGADASVVGRPVTLSGRVFTIVGIVSERFRGHFVGGGVDVWLPLEAALPLLGADAAHDGTQRPLQILARLGEGVSRAQASASLGALAPDIGRNRQERGVVRLEAVPGTLLHGRPRRMATVFLSLFTAMVGLVLLIAASNVANLLLARTVTRRREMAIRMSIGAGRLRIVQQLIVESLMLAAGGLAIALSIAWWAGRTFRSLALLPGFELRVDLAPDARVFAATAAVALLAGLVASLLPSLTATRGDVVPFLREGGASLGGRRQARVRGALVVAQVGIAVIVCVAAGLLTKSGRFAAAIDLGFETAGIFATDVDLDVHGYSRLRAETFYRELLARVSNLPDVAHAALASRAPLDSSTPGVRILGEGETELTPGASVGLEASYYVVTADYFAAVGVLLLAGRGVTDADRIGAPQTAVANEFLVHALWPGIPPQQAVGRRVRIARTAARGPGPRGEIEIVGIARNAKYRTLGEPDQPHLYIPYAQHYSASMAVLVRSRTQAVPAQAVQGVMATLDPAVQGFFTRTLEQHTRVALLPAIFASRVSMAVGIVSALLGAIGLYALIACVVAERRREFGLRMALGASAGKVLTDVVRQALGLSLAGCVAGAVGALLGARLLSSLLYGVSPTDPAIYAAVIAGAAAVAVVAAWIPARRASRVDPAIALRS